MRRSDQHPAGATGGLSSFLRFFAIANSWIVPYTPAGITDTVTRLVTTRLEQVLGQAVVVENRPGANSIIGTEPVL